MKAEKSSSGSVQSVERALTLLEIMGKSGGEMGIKELATQAELPAPTVHRLLSALAGRGYVVQSENKRYSLGRRLIRLGEVARPKFTTQAEPLLTRVRDRLGETTNLGWLERDEVVYIAQAQSYHSMRVNTDVGQRSFPHCTGVGKVLLARLSDEQVCDILDRTGMPRRTPHTMTSLSEFLDHLAGVRERGYAVDNGELEVGVRCIAVAVVPAPKLIALSVSGPRERIDDDVVLAAVPVLQEAAAQLSRSVSSVGSADDHPAGGLDVG